MIRSWKKNASNKKIRLLKVTKLDDNPKRYNDFIVKTDTDSGDFRNSIVGGISNYRSGVTWKTNWLHKMVFPTVKYSVTIYF